MTLWLILQSYLLQSRVNVLESRAAFVVILTTCKVIKTNSHLKLTRIHLFVITIYGIVFDSSV